MAFYEDYITYKTNHNLVEKFLISLGLLKLKKIIRNFPIDTSGVPREESTFVKESVSPFNEDMYIVDISKQQIEYGLYCDCNGDKIDSIEKYNLLEKESNNLLKKNLNDSTIILEIDKQSFKFDNYRKEFIIDIKVNANRIEHDIIEHYEHYVVFNVIVYNEEFKDYWGKLLLQGIELEKEGKYDLSFLLFFSAFDNYITLLTEELQSSYCNEIELEKLTFEKKVSLILRHHLSIDFSKQKKKNPTESLLIARYKELYEGRNAVAHGKRREITKKIDIM